MRSGRTVPGSPPGRVHSVASSCPVLLWQVMIVLDVGRLAMLCQQRLAAHEAQDGLRSGARAATDTGIAETVGADGPVLREGEESILHEHRAGVEPLGDRQRLGLAAGDYRCRQAEGGVV